MLALDQTDWRTPLLTYLLEEVLLHERTEARWIARRAKIFVVLGDELYKLSQSGVLMKCIPTNQGKQLLLDVHAKICGHHAARGRWSEKPFTKVFTSSPRYEMQRRSSAGVKDASSTLGKPIW